MIQEEKVYDIGFQLYEKGSYKDAAAIFTKLVLEEPFEESYWRGLASSRQMDNKYEAALHAWSIVALLSPKDPWPHFHAAECFFALRDTEEAEKALTLAEERVKKHHPLSEKLQQLRSYYGIEN